MPVVASCLLCSKQLIRVALQCSVETWLEAYHTADFIKSFLIGHLAVSAHIIAFPDEAGLVAASLLDVLVQAVEADIGLASLEKLSKDLALANIKVVADMLLLPLQYNAE